MIVAVIVMQRQRAAPWESGRKYPIELGMSFDSTHAFHTLKYDFKPKSIDHEVAGEVLDS